MSNLNSEQATEGHLLTDFLTLNSHPRYFPTDATLNVCLVPMEVTAKNCGKAAGGSKRNRLQLPRGVSSTRGRPIREQPCQQHSESPGRALYELSSSADNFKGVSVALSVVAASRLKSVKTVKCVPSSVLSFIGCLVII